jgi:hypothetical protein
MNKADAQTLILRGRVKEWNKYRDNNPSWVPDLSDFTFPAGKLVYINLTKANLRGADLSRTKLSDWWYEYRIKKAEYDIHTKWPEGMNPSDWGAILVSEEIKEDRDTVTAFISYAWTDAEPIIAIDQWLRNKGVTTRIDKRDFFTGEKIRTEILRVMRECDRVLVFYSANSRNKAWPQFERELAEDLDIEARKKGKTPPKLIYVVLDDSELPDEVAKNRLSVYAKGKRFGAVCDEIYRAILGISGIPELIDLRKWDNYQF